MLARLITIMLLALGESPSAFAAAGCTDAARAELEAKGVSAERIAELCSSASTSTPPTAAASVVRHPILEMAADASKLQSTTSGLKYRILVPGAGKTPEPKSKVVVHYTGVLENGTVFDSTKWRSTPAKFKVKDVIPGWIEGLQLIAEGGRILLVIPPHLAYGAAGTTGGPIGPNATLYFEVELVKVSRW